MSEQDKPLSTSALARVLDKSTKQMFAELEALGWIRRQEDNWQLTAKGEFEGGSYRNSDKFGRYIIWPAAVCRHPALLSADADLLSVSQLARKLEQPTRLLHWLLREIGWIYDSRKGWVLTDAGLEQGGRQREKESTGVPYVLWDRSLLQHPVLLRRLENLQAGAKSATSLAGLDGHLLDHPSLKQIDDWLYLARLNHAVRPPLPLEEQVLADFYLPEARLYIEYWQPDADPAQLKQMMHKRELYQLHGWPVIELQQSDLAQLDESLSRQLLRFGIEV